MRPAPGIPCALFFRKDNETQSSDAKSRRGNAKFWLPSCRGNPSRRGLSAAPQDEVSVSCSELNPHGEEPPTGPREARPDDRLRDDAFRTSPRRDSGLLRFARNDDRLFEKLNQQLPIRHFERSPGLLYSLPFGLSALAVPVPFLPLAA